MKYLDNIYGNNRHGFGMMWTENGEVIAKKGLMKKDEIHEMIKAGPKDRVAYHFRFATQGDISDNNAHPFMVNSDLWLMHNGTLNIDSVGKESDSLAFANIFGDLDKDDTTEYFLSQNYKESIESLIGATNRMLFMGFNKESKRVVNLIGSWYKLPDNNSYVSNTYSLRNPWRGTADYDAYDYYNYYSKVDNKTEREDENDDYVRRWEAWDKAYKLAM